MKEGRKRKKKKRKERRKEGKKEYQDKNVCSMLLSFLLCLEQTAPTFQETTKSPIFSIDRFFCQHVLEFLWLFLCEQKALKANPETKVRHSGIVLLLLMFLHFIEKGKDHCQMPPTICLYLALPFSFFSPFLQEHILVKVGKMRGDIRSSIQVWDLFRSLLGIIQSLATLGSNPV